MCLAWRQRAVMTPPKRSASPSRTLEAGGGGQLEGEPSAGFPAIVLH